MPDSMAYADVVLRLVRHFEHAEYLRGLRPAIPAACRAVIPPVGESLPNTEIFRRLAGRFGFSDAAFRESDAEADG